jgi:peptidoglycan/xylan/chitin deacetylase (PgdA/CDA1 family)
MKYGTGPFAHGLMFHHFHGGPHLPGQGSISPEEFDALLDFVDPSRILPAQEWLRRSLAGTLSPNDLCLTFDDALRCQFDIALPVLRRRGLTAFWFVYSSVFEGGIEPLEIYRHYRSTAFEDVEGFYDAFDIALTASPYADMVAQALDGVDVSCYLADFAFYTRRDRKFRYIRDRILGPQRYHALMDAMIAGAGLDAKDVGPGLWMDDDCLRALAAEGHVIGLHSYSHPTALADCGVGAQEEEYRRNFRHLHAVLGAAPQTVSHPCNSYNAATLELLSGMGVVLGFRANMARPGAGILEQPRNDHANILQEMNRQ